MKNNWSLSIAIVVASALAVSGGLFADERGSPAVTDYDRNGSGARSTPWEMDGTIGAPESMTGWGTENSGAGAGSSVDSNNQSNLRPWHDAISNNSEFEAYLSEIEGYQDRIDLIDTRTNELEDLNYNWVTSDAKEYSDWVLVAEKAAIWEPKITGTENFAFTQTRMSVALYQRTVASVQINIVNPDKTRPGDIVTETKEEPLSDSISRDVTVELRDEERCRNWSGWSGLYNYPARVTVERKCTPRTERHYEAMYDTENYPGFESYVKTDQCSNGYSYADYPDEVVIEEEFTFTLYGNEYTRINKTNLMSDCSSEYDQRYPPNRSYYGYGGYVYPVQLSTRYEYLDPRIETKQIQGSKGTYRYGGYKSSKPAHYTASAWPSFGESPAWKSAVADYSGKECTTAPSGGYSMALMPENWGWFSSPLGYKIFHCR